MASSYIEGTAKLLGKLAVEEVKYLAGVSDNVEELQSELEWMQCFLWDADEKQHKNALLRKWVSEVRDSALEAEDVIERYMLKVVKGKRQNKGVWSDLKWLSCCWRDAITLHNVRSDIDALSAKISKMSSRLHMYGVKSSYSYGGNNANLIADQRRTYSHLGGEDLVGLAQCVDDLSKELRCGTKKFVLIHGMGGIGKTTLAKAVFNHTPLKGKFQGFAWAYISQQLQLGAVCREILLQLIPKSNKDERDLVQGLEDSLLPRKLCEMLQQSNYLVVLDDLWNTGDWNLLEPAILNKALSDTSHHTKVLVTTRNPQLLSSLPSYDAMVFDYEVKLLDHDTSLELLQKNANFDAKNIADNINKLCERMLSHCNGHPLAIVVLGRVLATKKNVEEWQSVADNLPSYLQRGESYMGVYEVLALSYYELPYNIKPCFLHLGHFPEDFEIPAQKLHHIWIAEGIVSSRQDKKVANNSSLEDMCEVYLNKLVQNGMVSVGSGSPSGKISTCRLHDLMRDKCLDLNRDENFVEVINNHEPVEKQLTNLVTASNQKLRRLTIYEDHPCAVLLSLLSYGKKLSFVRSLVFFPSYKQEECKDVGECIVVICKGFQLLRVLDFEDLPLKGSIPKQFGSLIFLRYLSLKGTRITELPSSIGNLRSLIILDLRVKGVIIKIPNQIWKLKFLRHLYFPPRQLSQDSSFPRQEYEIKNDEMLNLEQLSYLEKLEDVDLDRVDVKGLVKLRSMRKLQASCVSNKESLMPFLKSKSLEMLSLKIHANIVVEDPMALSGCDFLQVLHMDGNIYLPPMRPNMFPQNLVELGFWYCEFEEDPMPLLETLRKLKNLQLHICYFGDELKCSEKAFPELTYLAIDGLFELNKWIVKKGAFPKLEKVEIYNSPIEHLPTVLPPNVEIKCGPCVPGIEQYGTCPFFKDY